MYTNFGDDRLRGLGVARGRISRFPTDLRLCPYNTLAKLCQDGRSWRRSCVVPAQLSAVQSQSSPTCNRCIRQPHPLAIIVRVECSVVVQCEQLTAEPVHWLSTQLTRHLSGVVRQPILASSGFLTDRWNHTTRLVGGSAQPNTAHIHTNKPITPRGNFSTRPIIMPRFRLMPGLILSLVRKTD